jgi:t-SNARE complex subunit (syntaxin)
MVCGQELEVLEALFARVARDRTDWLRDVREQAPAIKAQEELASQARLAEMRAAEARQREALALAQVERDRQQRIIVAIAVAAVVLVIVVALIAFAITVSGTPSPCFYPG